MAKIHFRPYNPNQTVLFPQRIDEDIADNDPVRMVDALVEGLNLESFRKLYKECGRSPYHPKMMLKVILYAYMNNVYSCRKIEKLLLRDIHFMWLAGNEKPDFITINRFRNRVKDELDKQLRQFRYDYPDVEFTVTRDQTELLDYSISNLINNIITGALLACVIIFFFMRDMKSPMLVILTGVIGGTLTRGLVGLFLGPVVLSVFYELVVAWTRLGTF